ncbi:hypothetical protein [Cellulosimicrobium sp. ES-005]|uniref:Uncharacterized protein n=1 Tax=Cellulosimicrobium sp. ES-005 TaxID=3163031 RepID=A0AAU8FY11_9MICO
MLYGPRRLSPRRIVGVPLDLLRAAGMEPPTRVTLETHDSAPETIVIQAYRAGSEHAGTISCVGQVVLPRGIVETLNLDQPQVVYMRLGDPHTGIEVMSPRQGLTVAAARYQVTAS